MQRCCQESVTCFELLLLWEEHGACMMPAARSQTKIFVVLLGRL